MPMGLLFKILVGSLVAFAPSVGGAQEPLVERFRVGSLDGVGPDAFERVSAAAISNDGRLYVADFQARRVTIWSLQGEYQGAFGRVGEGPGEFSFGLNGIAVVDSALVVVDGANAHLFRPDGTYLTRAFAETVTRVSMFLGVSAVDGAAIAFTREAEGFDQYSRAYPVGDDAALGELIAEWPRARGYLAMPGDDVSWAASSLGLVVSLPGRFALSVAAQPGMAISLDAARAPLTRESLERRVQYWRDRCISGEQRAECLDALAAEAEEVESRIDEPAPAVGRLVAAGEGRVAAARVDLSDDPFSSTTDHIEVVDLESRTSRMYRLPVEVDLLAMRGDLIVGVVRDEFDVNYVVGFGPAR